MIGPLREQVGVTIDTSAVGPYLESKTGAIREALARKMNDTTLMLIRKITTEKLEGQVLKHRTGKLVTSVRQGQEKAVVTPDSITGGVTGAGGAAWYGRLHEYGGTFEAHRGRRVALGSRKQRQRLSLQAKAGGEDYVTHVQSKPYTIHFPERSFMRSSLTEEAEGIIEGFQQTAKEAANS